MPLKSFGSSLSQRSSVIDKLQVSTFNNTDTSLINPHSMHSQHFDAIDELQVSTFSDMNTSLMNPYSDPLQASMHYANVSEDFISCSKRLHH